MHLIKYPEFVYSDVTPELDTNNVNGVSSTCSPWSCNARHVYTDRKQLIKPLFLGLLKPTETQSYCGFTQKEFMATLD